MWMHFWFSHAEFSLLHRDMQELSNCILHSLMQSGFSSKVLKVSGRKSEQSRWQRATSSPAPAQLPSHSEAWQRMAQADQSADFSWAYEHFVRTHCSLAGIHSFKHCMFFRSWLRQPSWHWSSFSWMSGSSDGRELMPLESSHGRKYAQVATIATNSVRAISGQRPLRMKEPPSFGEAEHDLDRLPPLDLLLALAEAPSLHDLDTMDAAC
eukprot:CAMPEP_0181409070 /NCGR_PEP_ID=MMETSP1110-20121109/6626_1 /TAXON_ID=174948 /ORGANISM="Symbiodinium sp., Strain CCMP421" /LENGTH=209 /DNA_ID=CAMNT_0023531559 /DNA_START=824 /DNA_END=1454 /DNA_ORIENTATION=-